MKIRYNGGITGSVAWKGREFKYQEWVEVPDSFMKDLPVEFEIEGQERENPVETSETPDLERFTKIKGIGQELAEELVKLYETHDNAVKTATLDDLEGISGVGVETAKKIFEQLKGDD